MIKQVKLRPTERVTVVNAAITCKKIEDERVANEKKFNEAVEKLKVQYSMDSKSDVAYKANMDVIKSYMGEEAVPSDIVEIKVSKTQNGKGEYERKTYVPTKTFEDATICRRSTTTSTSETATETAEEVAEEVAAENVEIEDADQEEITDFDNEF